MRFPDHISFILYAISDGGGAAGAGRSSSSSRSGSAEALHPVDGLDAEELKRQLLGFKLDNQEVRRACVSACLRWRLQ